MASSAAHAYQEWWNRWLHKKDDEAGNHIVEAYMPLVNYHVQRIASTLPKNISKDDLLSHGLTGLYDAMKKFDFSRDLKFDTYASIRIRGAIMDGLRQEDWLPRSLREKSKRIDDISSKLEQKLGRYATEEEVGQELNLSVEEVRKVVTETFFANTLSIDEETPEGEREETFRTAIEDKEAISPEESVMTHSTLKEIAQEIERLSEKEQIVLSLFYEEEMTLTEIGEIMSLSVSRISQIHSKALFRLRQSLKKHGRNVE
ncbi:FliA/WhiG family RNA polymerase sigma factor [Alteribacillus iranensis]|uniref:RNA polymerase, sigma 28 subunit, SigD/FliA/WhiG n=1 Tax=Alteribacillus iranensis TaxID=930128 RepID=A0A1I2A3Q1_9BACI|nr:FliA/WhiG family RNA polymerase sigma factor [Alteribacillus iranensis]SFE38591.1 RNA polymerase, sigma 28 subunit, SigD/FliA/WhiG [Alteribacillus iranensis]